MSLYRQVRRKDYIDTRLATLSRLKKEKKEREIDSLKQFGRYYLSPAVRNNGSVSHNFAACVDENSRTVPRRDRGNRGIIIVEIAVTIR